MAELLIAYLRISFSASVMILAVLLVRPILRKAPRNITCLLWLLVALRLLVPFELESPISLQPRPISESVSITELVPQPISPAPEMLPEVQPGPDTQVQQPVTEEKSNNFLNIKLETVITILWVTGSLGLLIYAAISLAVLYHRVRDAVRCPDGIWESDRIADAFLLGYWKPRIYLPVILPHRDREMVVAHERSHQSRGDQWWKLLGLVCLSVHWFNPLVWLSFWLMCRDIEDACDEKVIHNLDLDQRKNYSMALLNSGKRMSGFLSYPVSFGEVNLKHRIKSVLSYRKPALWVTLSAVTVAVVIGICFMTNPVNANECIHDFGSEIISEATCVKKGVRTDTCDRCKYSCEVSVPATGHHYENGIVTLEASCTTQGTVTYHCSICDYILTEAIPVVAHVFDKGIETQASTCSEKGELTYTCQVCGKTNTEALDTLAHTFGEKTVTKAPTCVSEGEISVSCSVCGYQEPVEIIPKSEDHDYENQVIRKATCINPGKGQEVCTLCGYSVECDYKLTDHSYGEAVVTKQATCTAKGERIYTCSVCNAVKTETVSKKDHTWNGVDCGTAAVCTVCGKMGPVQEHNYVMQDMCLAYPTSLGTETHICTRCGNTKTSYYGRGGTYDMEALEKAGVAYAKKLGFITNPCPGHGTYSKITRDPYYSVASRKGGQEWLEDMLISMINEMDSRCEDNTQYYAEVVVKYIDSHMTKEGAYFRLEVYYHHCIQRG